MNSSAQISWLRQVEHIGRRGRPSDLRPAGQITCLNTPVSGTRGERSFAGLRGKLRLLRPSVARHV